MSFCYNFYRKFHEKYSPNQQQRFEPFYIVGQFIFFNKNGQEHKNRVKTTNSLVITRKESKSDFMVQKKKINLSEKEKGGEFMTLSVSTYFYTKSQSFQYFSKKNSSQTKPFFYQSLGVSFLTKVVHFLRFDEP